MSLCVESSEDADHTIEETQAGAIAGGCTYYINEADAEWLAKNNVELAETTRSSSPPSGRAPPRSAKARGKEPEAPSVTITADEFELVMGILERLTDERYPRRIRLSRYY
ncbi:Enhancer of polycomb-like protein 1 [Ceratobasidium sp. 370]|nr:Enhancer of polycomb-like protein 1 [Ceratobasidium sp. 370]